MLKQFPHSGDIYSLVLTALIKQLMLDTGTTQDEINGCLREWVARRSQYPEATAETVAADRHQGQNLARTLGGSPGAVMTMRTFLQILEVMGYEEMSLIIQLRGKPGGPVATGVDVDLRKYRVDLATVDPGNVKPAAPKPKTPILTIGTPATLPPPPAALYDVLRNNNFVIDEPLPGGPSKLHVKGDDK